MARISAREWSDPGNISFAKLWASITCFVASSLALIEPARKGHIRILGHAALLVCQGLSMTADLLHGSRFAIGAALEWKADASIAKTNLLATRGITGSTLPQVHSM